MAIQTDEVQDERDALPDPPPLRRSGVGRQVFRAVLVLIVLAAIVTLGAYGSTRLVNRLGSAKGPSLLTHRVTRGELVVTVTEDGNVESANNVDIKCQVAGGSAILTIVKDGSEVKKGDKLVELEQSAIDDQINAQKITYEKARSSKIQAEKDYDVAQISVKEFLEGTYLQQLQDQLAQITIAEENLRTSKNSLEHTQRMFRKGYVSQLELEGQQFSVQRAQLELDSARTAKDVLEKFTKVKTLEDLQSKVETAQAKMESEKAAFTLEEARLKKLQDQLANCVINAPQDGMVVYANEQASMRFGSQQGPQIEEGAQVRERQSILRLPDLTQMQVKVAVHESKIESLKRGMRAQVKIQDKIFTGTVESIANQPEPTSFFNATVKEYAAIVRIDGETKALRPGMTAEVEILVAHLKDALTLPVACVVEQRGRFFCWVKKANAPERRPLVLGPSNDQFVEVKDGVSEGEDVLLNPRAVLEDAREDGSAAEPEDVQKKFGEQSAAGKGKSEGPAGPAPPGAGPPPGAEGAPPGPPAGAGGPGGPPGGPGGGMGDPMANDKDGDGKISKDEAPEPMKNFFDRIDANGDGFLERSEFEAMRNQRRGGGPGGPGGGPPNLMQYDKDGDGKVTKEEAPEFMQSFFDRLDGNGDGAIDRQEIDAMRSRMGGGGPGKPGGGGPGGPP